MVPYTLALTRGYTDLLLINAAKEKKDSTDLNIDPLKTPAFRSFTMLM